MFSLTFKNQKLKTVFCFSFLHKLSFKNKCNNIYIPFFSILTFLSRIFETYFFERCQTINIYILVVLNSYRILLIMLFILKKNQKFPKLPLNKFIENCLPLNKFMKNLNSCAYKNKRIKILPCSIFKVIVDYKLYWCTTSTITLQSYLQI